MPGLLHDPVKYSFFILTDHMRLHNVHVSALGISPIMSNVIDHGKWYQPPAAQRPQ